MHDCQVRMVGMELQQLSRRRLSVHEDLVRALAPGLCGTALCGVVSDEMVANEAVLTLLVPGASWVTVRRLLWRRG